MQSAGDRNTKLKKIPKNVLHNTTARSPGDVQFASGAGVTMLKVDCI